MALTALSSSLEDYLETIYNLVMKKKVARVKDISKKLGVNYSSVSGALRSLSRKGLIHYEPYEHVTLTSKGEKVAAGVVKKHTALRKFFINVLSIEAEKADKAACEMEHVISKDVLERIIQFADFVEACPRGGADWKEGLGYSCKRRDEFSSANKCAGDRKICKNNGK